METHEPHRIRVRCPACKKVFEELERSLEHPEAEEDDEPFVQEGRTCACPACGNAVALDLLECGADGVWIETSDV
jgi:endogenous inhibitor of DNA gyrase (YacG/DUF329 family)